MAKLLKNRLRQSLPLLYKVELTGSLKLYLMRDSESKQFENGEISQDITDKVSASLLSMTEAPVEAPPEEPMPLIYALFYSGLNLMLGSYDGASYVEEVASYTTVAAEPDIQNGTWIQNDSLNLVGDASYVFWGEKADTSNSIVVVDIQNGTEYTYDAPVGSTIFALMRNTTDGYLYWLEYKENGTTPGDYDVTMKKAKTDLTSQSTVGTELAWTTYVAHVSPVYSNNAIMFVNLFNDEGQHFSYVHRVSTTGNFSKSIQYEVSGFHAFGSGIPVPSFPDLSFGFWSDSGESTQYGAVDTTTAVYNPTVTPELPPAVTGVPSSFNEAGTRVLLFNGANVEVYEYGDLISAPLISVTLDEPPVESGYTTTDIFDIVIQ